jgi:hypothetical protein
MEELKEIIKMVALACDELGMKDVSGDMVLDCSVRIYNAGRISNNKPAVTEMATSKQQALLKRLGYKDNPVNLTKKDASKVIDEMINK